MVSFDESYLKSRPQSLCHMCGKCCRVVTTSYTYEELKEQVVLGISEAVDFLSVFEPYSSIDDARLVDDGVVENILKYYRMKENYDESKITFYCCKYLGDDNLCQNYENRPTLCKHFPAVPWAVVPPDCGFTGWLYSKREETKEKVRRVKENLLELELLKSKTLQPEELARIKIVEQKFNKIIAKYETYGSRDW
ncbi:MAG: YkgJ family cysteine cluster protein [Candidatus Gastranaerophilales bacterium]